VKPLQESHVAVVGLGLMGGSIAGALRPRCRSMTGVARRQETLDIALERELVDLGTLVLADGLNHADIVILATPVRTILRLLHEIGPLLPAGCLVTDLGSTKADIAAAMALLPATVHAIGGHPLCGRERAGIDAAEPTLYQGRTFVLTPLPRTAAPAVGLTRAMVSAVGARPLLLEPRRHDQLVAVTSHLPYLVACGLVESAAALAAIDPLLWEVTASGFRDTTRLAASDVTMMRDILMTNQEAVVEALASCARQLDRLASLIDAGDQDGLEAILRSVQTCRRVLDG
jgi:prephenate dehydrogenase